MTRQYSFDDKNLIERTLCELFPPEWLRDKAKETGLIKRERKIDPVIMFWTLAIGYGTFLQRTLAGLKRNYESASNLILSDSSWYYRFTPELVTFLRECVSHGLEHLAQEPNRTLSDRLSPFEDVLIQDSTIIRLHEKLADIWPATRSRKVAAGVKVAVLTSAIASGPKSVALFSENTNELKTLKIGPWIKDRILLIDLGFYKYQVFTRIKENGGYFVSRLKSNANPLIIESYRTHRGRSIDVRGKQLQDVLKNLKRQVLDVEVEVTFNRRAYRGKEKKDSERFRLVAVYNEDEDKYHLYITNLSTDLLKAEEVARLYGARWEVEILFKELKSKYALDVVPTSNPQVIEAFIWIAILTLLISRKIYTIIRRLNPGEKVVRFTQLRWGTVFSEKANYLLADVLEYLGLDTSFITSLRISFSEALDPHVNRRRYTEEWWA
ncbi:IS4 family transposase [Methanosaeta sp. UBA356]|mgnify:FL=1|uniref:IS4 family transposase n=1 Tax=Methanosaeta sp. UBA356 TaxID=1915559 RepID=UPI003741E92D